MSEAVEVVTDYWFNELGFSVMRVPKAVVNTASRRISEKSGMRVIARKGITWQGGFRLRRGRSPPVSGVPTGAAGANSEK